MVDPPSRPDQLADFIERGQRAQTAVSFELAAAELRAIGIALTRLPGEYRVNYRDGQDATARVAETIDQALEAGRAMAADRPPAATRGPRRRRPLRMTPKAHNRRMRMKQLRRMRARAIRQEEKKE